MRAGAAIRSNTVHLYPVYMVQKWSRLWSGSQSGLQSRRCTRLHGTFIVQYNNASHCWSLFSHCYIAIYLISWLKLSRSGSRSSLYTGQNFAIQIAICIIFALCKQGISVCTCITLCENSVRILECLSSSYKMAFSFSPVLIFLLLFLNGTYEMKHVIHVLKPIIQPCKIYIFRLAMSIINLRSYSQWHIQCS